MRGDKLEQPLLVRLERRAAVPRAGLGFDTTRRRKPYREGKLKWRETVAEGIEAAPAAFANVFRGGNIGKQLVRLV